MQQIKTKTGEKVIKLREELDVLGRILIIQRSRKELVPKLEEIIGNFELSVAPPSLCAVDRSLYIPTDKASLMHAIVLVQAQQIDSMLSSTLEGQLTHIKVIDAMAVLHTIKKTSDLKIVQNLIDVFVKKIKNMLINYKVGYVVFVRYMEKPLNNKTQQKISKTETSVLVHKETKLTMTLKELFSSSDTKENLTAMLAEELLKIYSNQDDLTLYVIYDNKIKEKYNVEEHNQEEADTLTVHQVLTSVSQGGLYHIDVWSPDTDVLILLLDLVANKDIQRPN